MARRHNRGMILILESRRAEINQSNLRVQKNTALGGMPIVVCRGRGNPAVVRERLVRVIAQQDVFRLQVGVNQVQIVKNCRTSVSQYTPRPSSKTHRRCW